MAEISCNTNKKQNSTNTKIRMLGQSKNVEKEMEKEILKFDKNIHDANM